MSKAFEFADGMVKQLLTLATGSLGGLIAIFDDKAATGIQLSGSYGIHTAIALLAASVVCGVVTLGCLTGQAARSDGTPDLNSRDVRFPAMAQMVTFALGIVAAALEVSLR